MSKIPLLLSLLIVVCCASSYAQQEVVLQNAEKVADKKLTTITDKTTKYTDGINKVLHTQDSAVKKITAPLQTVNTATDQLKKYDATIAAQTKKGDSLLNDLEAIPAKYIKSIDDKVEQYTNRINKKTLKTLEKLSRWENKIKPRLQKINPLAAERLFGSGQATFTSLLQQVKSGESLSKQYHAQYSAYNDKLTTHLKYLEQQKSKLSDGLVQPVTEANKKVANLTAAEDKNAAIQQFIKERKKKLLDGTIQYLGKCKYLDKINKEDWYYVNTLKNYKEIFADKKKAEKTATDILNKIPAYQQFTKQNSQLASLFGLSGGNGDGTGIDTSKDITGLQKKTDVQNVMKEKMQGEPDVQQLSQNMQQGKQQLNQLKDKVNKYGSSSDAAMPDFKPNTQKTKTFAQRLEYGTNLQFGKSNNWVPGVADIAGSIGYKINDKSIIGIGLSYKMGMGTLDHIQISHQGIGIRSFADWKIKKQFFISGGFEMNCNTGFKKIKQLEKSNVWQQAALIGITKKFAINTKFFKGQSIQLLYDFLCRQHTPASQPILFRVGYKF